MAFYKVLINDLMARSLIESLYLIIWLILCVALLFFLLALSAHLQHESTLKFKQLFKAEMEPLILGVIFQDQSPNIIWEKVSKKNISVLMDLLLGFHQRLSGSALSRLALISEPYLEVSLKQVGHKQPEIRAKAYKILSTFASTKYENILVKGLNDESPLVVHIVFQALTQSETAEHSEALLACLPTLENFSSEYISSLLYRKGADLSRGLRLLYASLDTALALRIIAAKTLTLLQDTASLELACHVLKHEQETDLLIPTLDLLEKLGTSQVSELVFPLLASEAFPVRAYALKVISSFEREKQTDLYLTFLTDSSPWVAKQAAMALLRAGQLNILKSLVKTKHAAADLAEQVLSGVSS